VKIARHFVLKNGRQPDVVVSGVNHGSNTSISVLYSGTMSAAIEGAIEGTPAIGFSLATSVTMQTFPTQKNTSENNVTGTGKGIT
jgi:5'/3'-nucleotidase SurE